MIYRLLMKLAHKYNWHYAPPIYCEGDTILWCQWCGFQQVVKLRDEWPGWQPALHPRETMRLTEADKHLEELMSDRSADA